MVLAFSSHPVAIFFGKTGKQKEGKKKDRKKGREGKRGRRILIYSSLFPLLPFFPIP